jgi:hypothetical protein
MTNGPLTQSLNAATASVQRILSYQGLPPDAAKVQATTGSFMNTLRPQILDMQQQVQTVTASSQTALTSCQTILTAAQGNLTPGQSAEIGQSLTGVQANCTTMAATVTTVTAAVGAFYTQVTEGSQQLAVVSSTLNTQKVGLQSQLDSCNANVASIQSNMKYYALLGILGLPGLAAAGILLHNAQSEVNDLSAQMGALSQQIAQTTMVITEISMMASDVQNLSSITLKVNNSSNFVSSDIGEVVNDVQKSNSTVALVYINTALVELQTLANDAS